MNPNQYQPGDPRLVKEIVDNIKFRGVFDEIRKECLADVDTKPAYQNLRGRVDNFVNRYLFREQWSQNMNKNQLRNALRKEIEDSGMLSSGVDRIIEQVVNPKVYKEFKPVIEKIICEHLGIDVHQRRERERRQMEILQKIQQRDRGELEPHDTEDVSVENGFSQPPPSTQPQAQASPSQPLHVHPMIPTSQPLPQVSVAHSQAMMIQQPPMINQAHPGFPAPPQLPVMQPGMVPGLMPRIPGQMAVLPQFVPGMPLQMQAMFRPHFMDHQLLQQQQAALAEMAKYAPLGTQFPPLPASMRNGPTTPGTPRTPPFSRADDYSLPVHSTAPSFPPPVSSSSERRVPEQTQEEDGSLKSVSPDPLYPPGTTPPRPQNSSPRVQSPRGISPRAQHVPSPRGSPESMEMSDTSDDDSPPPDLGSEEEDEPMKIDMAFDPNASFLTLLTSPRGADPGLLSPHGGDTSQGLDPSTLVGSLKDEKDADEKSDKSASRSGSDRSSSEKDSHKTLADPGKSIHYGKAGKKVSFSDGRERKGVSFKGSDSVKSESEKSSSSSKSSRKSDDPKSSDSSRSKSSDNKDKRVESRSKDYRSSDTKYRPSSSRDSKGKSSDDKEKKSDLKERKPESKLPDSKRDSERKSDSTRTSSSKERSSESRIETTSSSSKSKSSSSRSDRLERSSRPTSPDHRKTSSERVKTKPNDDDCESYDVTKLELDDSNSRTESPVDSKTQEAKKYTFAWDNLDEESSSDSDVSSVNTSDLSSTYEISEVDEDEEIEDEEKPIVVKVPKKTKEQRKQELHEQKIQERQTQRQRRKNKRYLGDFESYLSSESEIESEKGQKRKRKDERATPPIGEPVRKRAKGPEFGKARRIVRGEKMGVAVRQFSGSMSDQALASRPRMPRRTCIPSGLRPAPLAVNDFNILLSRRSNFIPVTKKGKKGAAASRSWPVLVAKPLIRSNSPLVTGSPYRPNSPDHNQHDHQPAKSKAKSGNRETEVELEVKEVEYTDVKLETDVKQENETGAKIQETETVKDVTRIEANVKDVKNESDVDVDVDVAADVDADVAADVGADANVDVDVDADVAADVDADVAADVDADANVDVDAGEKIDIKVEDEECQVGSKLVVKDDKTVVMETGPRPSDSGKVVEATEIETVKEKADDKAKMKTIAAVQDMTEEDHPVSSDEEIDVGVSELCPIESETAEEDRPTVAMTTTVLETTTRSNADTPEASTDRHQSTDTPEASTDRHQSTDNKEESVESTVDKEVSDRCDVLKDQEDQKSMPSDVTSNEDDVTPRVDDVTSHVDDVTPRVDDVTSHVDDVTPHVDDVTDGADVTSTDVTEDVTLNQTDVTLRHERQVPDTLPLTTTDTVHQSPLCTDSPTDETLPRVGPPSPGATEPFSPQHLCMPRVGLSSPTEEGALSPSSTMASSPRVLSRSDSPVTRRVRKSTRQATEEADTRHSGDTRETRTRRSSGPKSGRSTPVTPVTPENRKRKSSETSGRTTPDSKSGESSRSNSPPRRTSRRHSEKRVWSPEPDTPRSRRSVQAGKPPPAKKLKH